MGEWANGRMGEWANGRIMGEWVGMGPNAIVAFWRVVVPCAPSSGCIKVEGSSSKMEGEDFYTEPESWCQNQCGGDNECKGYAFLAVSGGKTTCTLYRDVTSDQSMAMCNSFKCNSTFGFCNGGAVTNGGLPSLSPDIKSPFTDTPLLPTLSGTAANPMAFLVATGIFLLA
jgi:hypothetical protein